MESALLTEFDVEAAVKKIRDALGRSVGCVTLYTGPMEDGSCPHYRAWDWDEMRLEFDAANGTWGAYWYRCTVTDRPSRNSVQGKKPTEEETKWALANYLAQHPSRK